MTRGLAVSASRFRAWAAGSRFTACRDMVRDVCPAGRATPRSGAMEVYKLIGRDAGCGLLEPKQKLTWLLIPSPEPGCGLAMIGILEPDSLV
jgi:hypothetical protein